jgi:hypothetical protein
MRCVTVVYVEGSATSGVTGATDGAGVVLRRQHVVEVFFGDAVARLEGVLRVLSHGP